MKVTSLETTIVSVPYRHRETSSRVRRDGVTDVLVKISTDSGHAKRSRTTSTPPVYGITVR